MKRYLYVILIFFLCSSAWAGPTITRNPNFDPSNAGTISGITTGVFGDSTNNMTITNGVATLNGTAKRGLTIRPTIDVITQIAQAKPTQVTYGTHKGFSMPVYNSDNEELYAGCPVPKRWDATSNFTIRFVCSLSGNEDVGDKFKFQLLWDAAECEGTTVNTSVTATKEIIIVSGRSTQYSNYCLDFTIDYDATDHIVYNDSIIGVILRRIAASSNEVDNEIIVWQHSNDIRYQINKIYGEF